MHKCKSNQILQIIFLLILSGTGFTKNDLDELRPDGIDDNKWTSLKNSIQDIKLLPQPAGIGGNNIRVGRNVSIDGDRALIGAFNMDTSGVAYILEFDGSNWSKTATLKPTGVNNQIFFGISVSLLGDRALIGADGNIGKAYIFDLNGTNWTQSQVLTASDGEDGDFFGRVVSLGVDRAVIGVEFDDLSPNLFLAGSAYVFDYNGTTWTETQKLTASDAMRSDRFGNVVSVSGDTVLVGASSVDGSFIRSGAVYVFSFDGSSWTQTQKLAGSSDERYTGFGNVISTSGDKALIGTRKEFSYLFSFDGTNWIETKKFSTINGDYDYSSIKSVSIDGSHLAICGLNNGNSMNESSIFNFNGTDWIGSQKITSPDLSDTSSFGSSVGLSGNNLIIGSDYAIDINGNNSGAAFTYRNIANTWENQFRFSISEDGSAGTLFGFSVSMSGDRALVGAFGDNDNGSLSGSAYIFDYDGISWNETHKLVATDGDVDDQFGYSVSLVGDRALIGANGGGDNGYFSGSAYVFDYNGVQWTQTQKLTASDGASSDNFGKVVSLTDNRLLIGAYRNINTGRGAAYVFDLVGTTWVESQKLTVLDSDEFGDNLYISGDRAIVTDSRDDQTARDAGAVYIFDYDGTSWLQTHKLIADDGESYDKFGTSVHMYNSSIVVGAKYDNLSAGSVYVYEFNGTTWNQVQKLEASDTSSGARFGNSVQIFGNTLLVASRRHNTNTFIGSGSAYVFKNFGSGWVQNQQIIANDASDLDFFSRSISLGSRGMLIGADGDDTNGNDSGSAYLMVVDSVFKGGFE